MKISSWNVAGLRACEKKGFYNWYLKDNADIICLQETKALEEQLSEQMLSPEFHKTFYVSAKKKGYSGVSTWVRKGLNVTHKEGLGIDKFDNEGRTIISEFDDFILFNCYFPNGQRDHARVPYKLEYSKEVQSQAVKLQKRRPVILTGDFNTAHREIDLENPKTNKNSSGFLLIEREWMDQFEKKGFIDLFREKNKNESGNYTWWTYRGDCRSRNIGWRIDYFWSSPQVKKILKNCFHQKEVLGSDHCPLSLELKM